MAIQEREADLVIATFGRSIWVLDDINPLRKLASNKGSISKNLTVFPAGDAYQMSYRSAPGYEWSVAGLWDAPNKRRGAPISFLVNKLSPRRDTARAGTDTTTRVATTGGGGGGQGQGGGGRGGQGGQGGQGAFSQGAGRSTGDTALVRIYNDKNVLIRTLRWGVDSGWNRQYWGMEEKGFRGPNSPKPRPGAPEPGGFQVLPGTYKIVLTYNRESDSTMINVKDDPRLGNRNDIKLAQRKMYERLRKSIDKLNEATDRLTEADEVLTKMSTQLRGLEGKEMDSLRRMTTAMQDSIRNIREFVSGRSSTRQGISRSLAPTVLTRIQEANQNIGAKMVNPGVTEEKLVENAESLINTVVQRTNNLFDGKWSEYRKLVENTKVNLFKDYKPIQ